MIKANGNHKKIVVDIISSSFDDNKSINWIIKNDKKRKERIRFLAGYSFDICMQSGVVYLSDDQKGCVLLQFPERKKTNLKTIWLDVKLAVKAIGIDRALKIMNRESKINAFHPKGHFLYLWFIGVAPEHQGKGCGAQLLQEVIKSYPAEIYLETSTVRNVPWYQKFGFDIYHELDDFGYKIFMMKRASS